MAFTPIVGFLPGGSNVALAAIVGIAPGGPVMAGGLVASVLLAVSGS